MRVIGSHHAPAPPCCVEIGRRCVSVGARTVLPLARCLSYNTKSKAQIPSSLTSSVEALYCLCTVRSTRYFTNTNITAASRRRSRMQPYKRAAAPGSPTHTHTHRTPCHASVQQRLPLSNTRVVCAMPRKRAAPAPAALRHARIGTQNSSSIIFAFLAS